MRAGQSRCLIPLSVDINVVFHTLFAFVDTFRYTHQHIKYIDISTYLLNLISFSQYVVKNTKNFLASPAEISHYEAQV